MNIIEKVKSIINNAPNISDFSNGIHIDYTEDDDGSFGIFSTDDKVLKEDVLGNQTRRHEFFLYANNQSVNDYDRLQNSTFLINLGYWLETQKNQTFDVTVGSATRTGTITNIYSANAMAYDVMSDDINDGITYRIQIYVEYTVS